MKIAISGKGGVGKTTLMALLARQLRDSGKDVLVIDADPSPHMAQTLGIEDTDAIIPISEMKDMLVERSGKTPGSPFYNINPQVDDLISQYMVEKNGIKLMVLGAIQSADSGCACAENTVLRRMLTKLILTPSQIVLLDMEAGVEHLGRGTIAGVDHLLIVVIPSKSSLRTAEKIKKLAQEVAIPKIHFVGNLIHDREDENFLTKNLDAQPIACFPDSGEIRQAERKARTVADLTDRFSQPLQQILDIINPTT